MLNAITSFLDRRQFRPTIWPTVGLLVLLAATVSLGKSEAILPRKGVARFIFLVADFSIGEVLAAGDAAGEGVAFDSARTTPDVESIRAAIHVPTTNELLFFIFFSGGLQATLPAIHGRYLSFRYSAV